MHRARETKTHRAHLSWVEEMGGGGGRRTGQDRDAECVVVARPLTRENARMSRTREAQLCAIRGSCTPHRRWPGPREGFESGENGPFWRANGREALFGGVGQPEQRGGERNAARSGTGMYRSWRGKENIKNRIEMKTKKRTRSWPSRGSHIHGRVVMVTTAGEWVPLGGRALPGYFDHGLALTPWAALTGLGRPERVGWRRGRRRGKRGREKRAARLSIREFDDVNKACLTFEVPSQHRASLSGGWVSVRDSRQRRKDPRKRKRTTHGCHAMDTGKHLSHAPLEAELDGCIIAVAHSCAVTGLHAGTGTCVP
ncbi:hypothetical protein F5148DRAFT_1365239 [Russula earlei]|uniref:Uncharacterized protein n=1 Tax=Russula earlei TaxID=71964 RepID=A0ACC0UMD6_9AGAM|nr:hypothetical protein F5148DRAFT_1365239 [Russula earlei]